VVTTKYSGMRKGLRYSASADQDEATRRIMASESAMNKAYIKARVYRICHRLELLDSYLYLDSARWTNSYLSYSHEIVGTCLCVSVIC
jgi:hypothetical protein